MLYIVRMGDKWESWAARQNQKTVKVSPSVGLIIKRREPFKGLASGHLVFKNTHCDRIFSSHIFPDWD